MRAIQKFHHFHIVQFQPKYLANRPSDFNHYFFKNTQKPSQFHKTNKNLQLPPARYEKSRLLRKRAMYESSCSYGGALELKRGALKEEPWATGEWPPYRLHQSTFEQLKQSVEKAKAALQDRSGFLGTASAFSDLYAPANLAAAAQEAAPATTFNTTTRHQSRPEDSTITTLEHKSKSIGEFFLFIF